MKLSLKNLCVVLVLVWCGMASVVRAQPLITTQPKSQLNLSLGVNTSLNVVAQGSGSLKYQWRLNGVNIPGANSDKVVIATVQLADCGNYTVAVGDDTGFISSAVAKVTVNIQSLGNNDDFSTRMVLNPWTNGMVRSDNFNAGKEPGEPDHAGNRGGKSIWFKWTPLASGIVTFQTAGSGFDTLLAVYEGTTVSTLRPELSAVNDDDGGGFLTSKISFNVVSQTEYEIAVDGFDGDSGEVILSWSTEITVDQLPSITLMPVSETVSNDSGLDLSCEYSSGQKSPTTVWFFNGQSTGVPGKNYRIGKVDDSTVGIYFAEITTDLGHKTRTLPAYVQVNILQDGSTDTNTFSLDKFLDSVYHAGKTPNTLRIPGTKTGGDTHGYSTMQIFSTAGSTKEPGEPDHCGQAGGASEWYVYNTPTNGTLHINTDGSSYNTILAIYVGPGDSFATLTNVGCGFTTNYTIAGQPHVYISNVSSNVTYYIAVDGIDGATGTVHLNVNLGNPVALTTSPPSQTVPAGTNVTFSAAASGSTPLSYFWQFNGTNIAGATNTSLTVTNVQSAQTGTYTIVASNLVNVVTSSPATLALLVAPTITTQPTNQTVNVGSNVTFICMGSGTAPLNYQWRFSGVGGNIAGATNTSLLVTNAQATSGGNYRCVITNSAGSITSSIAVLTVNTPPGITAQPASRTVTLSSNATLTVTATGTPAPGYQWQFNGLGVGTSLSSLTITNFQSGNEGTYRVVVTNSLGSVMSSNAVLLLNSPVRLSSSALTNSSFQFQLIGVAGSNYIVQASTNLQNWSSLLTNNAPNGFLNFSDTNASNFNYRFYRGQIGP